jgi:hypothetical protein
LLTHQIGRTWSARAAYRRGADFVEAFSAPVFTDAVTVALDGFINRRTDVAAAVAYSGGNVVQARSNPFETYTATARLRFGLTRQLAAYAEYLFYDYDSAGVALNANVPPRVSRHSVRVGLTLWVPLLRN